MTAAATHLGGLPVWCSESCSLINTDSQFATTLTKHCKPQKNLAIDKNNNIRCAVILYTCVYDCRSNVPRPIPLLVLLPWLLQQCLYYYYYHCYTSTNATTTHTHTFPMPRSGQQDTIPTHYRVSPMSSKAEPRKAERITSPCSASTQTTSGLRHTCWNWMQG